MRILHISTPLSWRGGEQQLAYLAETLRARVEEQIFMCAAGGEMEHFCHEEEFTSFPIRPSFLQMAANAALLKRICRNYKIQVIHTHDSKAHTLAYVAGLLGNKTPIVVSRRVDFPVGKSWLSRRKYNYSRVRRIVCVSEAIREITGASIADKNVLRVIYDGVETESPADEQPADLQQEFGWPADIPVIGNVAALADHKDYFTWLDAAAELLKTDDVRFVAIGDGPLATEIKAYCTKLGLDEKVKFTGFRTDAKALLAGLDIFMMSSKTEGLGSSVLDAYVRGIPVVTTAAGGLPEIVKDGETGLLAPVQDSAALASAVRRLLHEPGLKEKLARQAHDLAAEFSKEAMARHTLREYEAVIREAAGTPA